MNGNRLRYPVLILGLTLMVLLAGFADVLLGSYYIEWTRILSNQLTENEKIIIWQSRFPEALTAILAGTGLSVSGLLMQTLFRNPLAGPSVLGISSGSALGMALAVLAGVSFRFGQVGSAIAGSLSVLFLLLFFARFLRKNSSLLIAGLMIGYAVSSLVNILEFLSDNESLRTFVFWGFGSFSSVNSEGVTILSVLTFAGTVSAFSFTKSLDAMLFGEDYSKSLGIKTGKIRILILLLTGILTGSVTAFCGPVAFLGIAVPHLGRMLLKDSTHLKLLPVVILCGMAIALICDLISRTPGAEGNIPVNVVTCLLGAPVVIWLLFKSNNTL